jgi:hypothetical protein
MRRHWPIFFCALIVLAAVIVGISQHGDMAPVYSLSFQGYSNSVSGQKWAILTFTNRDTCEQVFSGPYTVEFRRIECDSNEHWKIPDSVPRGSSCTVAIEIPNTSETWRASWSVTRREWRDVLEEHLPNYLRRFVFWKSFYGEFYNVQTDWIPK